MPTNETGAVAFKRPTRSGTAAASRSASWTPASTSTTRRCRQTTTGERKIVDWVTATDPLEDGTWRPMLTEVAGPTFTYRGGTWTAPAGTYRFNLFSESHHRGERRRAVTSTATATPPTPGACSTTRRPHDIRVDANQDRNFTDDPVMRPYKEKYDVGHFGTDNPATAVARAACRSSSSTARTSNTTPGRRPGHGYDYVNIGIVEGEHGTHVAGITAANDLFGNASLRRRRARAPSSSPPAPAPGAAAAPRRRSPTA